MNPLFLVRLYLVNLVLVQLSIAQGNPALLACFDLRSLLLFMAVAYTSPRMARYWATIYNT